MIDEWEKRNRNEILADHLRDTHDKNWEEYHNKYSNMADEKRVEAASQRKREKEINEYKNEKRRHIPTWPETVPYSKFKPDLLSWDKDHQSLVKWLKCSRKNEELLLLSKSRQDLAGIGMIVTFLKKLFLSWKP